MKGVGESDLLTAILRRRSSAPSVEDRALAYVRELYGPDVVLGELSGSPLDFLHAKRSAELCRECPGRGDCPEKGMVSTVVEETWGRARRFSVRMGSCVSADRERRRAELAAVIASSRIPRGMEGCTFDTFVTKDLDRSVREAKGIAMACVEDGASLVLGGGTGVGKTHLAVAMVQALTARGTAALFVSTVDLLDEIRAGYETGRAARIEGAAREADMLVLDDVGAQRTDKPWTSERLFALLDGRYRDRRQTVITTNAKTMKELADMFGDRGERIVSRLMEMAHAYWIKASDYRLRRHDQRRIT